jgi:UTP-glucose-1-phosphate uridylyltransferase
MKIVQAELGMSCMPLQIGAVTPVAQALIPAASFSSALFPASKCLPPALFPVMDADGLLKPAILILVEEAIAAGLHRVVIVVSAAQHADFETIFHKQASMREYNRVPERLRQYADSIVEMGRKVHLVVQEEQHGLGHAVLCARAALEPAPFVLMLGDHLYRSSTGTSCVAQLVSAYAGRSLIALRRTAEIDISHLGTACGKWEATRDAPAAYRRLALSALVEKPSTDYARANLVTPGLPNGEYLTAFGLYVIHEYRSLFEVLQEEHQVREQLGPSASLLQLTPALDRIRAEAGLAGILLDGERYDIGHTPADYLATLNALAKKPSGEDSDLA